MKRTAIGLAALMIMTMGCNKTDDSGYIGQSDVVIEDGVMTPETLLSFGRLSDPQLSPDGTRILYGVSYTSIEQNRSCRNLFLCNTDGTGKVQLTRYAKSVSNARWSKDGSSIYFLQGGQIWKAQLSGNKLGKRIQLSDVPSGIVEFKLSPDESKVLYISTIKNPKVVQPADTDPALDKASAYVTEDLMYRHWDHWVTETPRSYVAPFGTGKVTPDNSRDLLGEEPYELPTEPFGRAEQLDWAPDGRHIAYSCRKHMGKEYAFSTNCGIYVYDAVSGETVTVKGDGGYDTDPLWSPDGKHLAWVSMARDGYEADKQRLFVADVEVPQTENDGFGMSFSRVRELDPGFKYDVSGLVWNAEGTGLVFSSLAEGVQKIFCTGLDGVTSQLTKDGWDYDFSSPFAMTADEAAGTRTLLASYDALNFPTELVAVTLKGEEASFAQITHENEHILSQLDEPTSKSVYVKTVDGQDMQCWVLYPPKFDSTKVYPAIEIVLGGPQGTNSQGWSYRWCYRLMAQQGYIVIMPNRRGTTAFGQEWKEQISGDYCGLNMQDYLCAGRYIKSQPYVGKLACVGASYGGYSAYMLEGLHGDLYDCFIAHAGIFDEKGLWFTTEEMWFANWDNGGLTEYSYTAGQQGPAGDGITFGGMQQAGAPYSTTPKALRHYDNSPSAMVTKWHTPILCIHGMMDFRIPYTQGMAAFNAAQMMGVPSKLVIFPEENHWILQPQNSLFWHREVYDWLNKWLK
jgi:Dipeptidyl aminopeptidases/acylaminoacyl-peptidases